MVFSTTMRAFIDIRTSIDIKILLARYDSQALSYHS